MNQGLDIFKRFQGGGKDVAAFTEKELREMPSWMRDILLTTPKYPRATRQGEEFDPGSVPVMQGPQGRFYDPRYSREDERIMAKEGNANVEPLRLAGGSSNLPQGFTSFWPGGGRWEGPNRVAAGPNILGGHGWQYYDIGNPNAPWIGLEGPRGTLGQWVDVPGESRRGRVIDVKQKGYGGFGVLKRGQYDRHGNWIPGSGGGGGGGTIPGGPFEGWTPQAMNQWHSGTPPSQMNYPSFTGNTAGPGGQQLAYNTTSYNIPGYGWVPQANLANAQASNNLWDYMNPFGHTSRGGSGTGDPTQRNVGRAVGSVSNFFIPGSGFITGPIARWLTSKFQGQNPTRQQIQQAVQQAQQPQAPAAPASTTPAPPPSAGVGIDPFGNPADPGEWWSNDFGRWNTDQYGTTPGNYNLAGPGGQFGAQGLGSSGFGGTVGTRAGFSTAIGFGGPFGGGIGAGSLNTRGRDQRQVNAIRNSIMAGTYNPPPPGAPLKYPSPVLQQMGVGLAKNMGMVRTSGQFGGPMSFAYPGATPVNWDEVGKMWQNSGAFGGGEPPAVGGGAKSLKPNVHQQSFAMGTSSVNPGLKLFHAQQKRKKQ